MDRLKWIMLTPDIVGVSPSNAITPVADTLSRMEQQDAPLSDTAKANVKATRRADTKRTGETVKLAGMRGLKHGAPPFGMPSRVWSRWDIR
jgi:hypothetical protein